SAPQPQGGEPVFLAPVLSDRGRLRRLSDAQFIAEPDLYFPVLHGTYGEDGTVQGLLELAGVPYVGSGVAASAAGMDKELMKSIFAQAALPQVPYRVFRRGEDAQGAQQLGFPLFVKPANPGSSVGVSKVKSEAELPRAVAQA